MKELNADAWFCLAGAAIFCTLVICIAVGAIDEQRIEAEVQIEAIKAGLEQEVIKVGVYAPIKIWVKKSNKLRVEE